MKYYIITGASKGLGEKLVDQLLDQGHSVIGVSRSGHKEHKMNKLYTEMTIDLSNEEDIKNLITRSLEVVNHEKVTGLYLINNAGGLDPIGAVGSLDPDDIFKSLRLNVAAPMVFCNAFIKETEDINCDKRIISLSSGAGKNALYGWNSYCVAKAGIDMMTKSIGLEQGQEGVRAIALRPGIMDTGMQAHIRSQTIESMKDVEKFKRFKNDGVLRKPEDVARTLLDLLHDDTVEAGLVADVKDFD